MKLAFVIGIVAIVGGGAATLQAQGAPGSLLRYDFRTRSTPVRPSVTFLVPQAPVPAPVIVEKPVEIRATSRAVDCAMPTPKVEASVDPKMPVAVAGTVQGSLSMRLIPVPPCSQK